MEEHINFLSVPHRPIEYFNSKLLYSRKKVVQHRRRANREAPAIPYPYSGASLLIRRLPNFMGRESPAPPYSRGADVGLLSSDFLSSHGTFFMRLDLLSSWQNDIKSLKNILKLYSKGDYLNHPFSPISLN